MKEFLWSLTGESDVTRTVLSVVPHELIPFYFTDRSDFIFNTLDTVARTNPELGHLAAGIMKDEVNLIFEQNQGKFNDNALGRLQSAIYPLPDIHKELKSEKPVNRKELFLLEHDIAAPLYTLNNRLNRKNTPDAYRKFYDIFRQYGKLSYRYDWIVSEGITALVPGYSKLLREVSRIALIPKLQQAIQKGLPFGTFELFEVRSAFRDLAQIPSTEFAEYFSLRSTIEEFVKNRKFYDKNTVKPVSIVFDPDSTDPMVYMDKGDLYRMVRNLLRDAVTHGEAPVIQPVIKIGFSADYALLQIYSPGTLDEKVLAVIGREPYTTQDRGEKPHGYGKVGARQLLESLWRSLGTSEEKLDQLMKDHWANVQYKGFPYVRWQAPIPAV